MEISTLFIFQIGNSCVISKLPIYESLNNLESTLSKKGTFASLIKKNPIKIYFPYSLHFSNIINIFMEIS